MTAVIGDSDLGRLCALARQWHGNPFGLGRARDLAALLDEITARRSRGGDVLQADVRGDSVPEMHAAALVKAAELWGPAARLEVQSTGTVYDVNRPGRGDRIMTAARRLLAALALALLLAAGLAACTPASPPSHFGNCPAGQHWQQVKLSNFGWECEP